MAEIVIYKQCTRCYIQLGEYSELVKFKLKADLENFTKKHLTSYKYNHRFRRWEKNAVYSLTDHKLDRWYFPTPFLTELKNWFYYGYHTIRIVELESYPVRPAHFKMSKTFTVRDDQRPAIDFLKSNINGRGGLELQTGCIAEDTPLFLKVNQLDTHWTVKEFYNQVKDGTIHLDGSVQILRFNETYLEWVPVEQVLFSDAQLVYTLLLKNGKQLRLTKDHPVKTLYGYFPVSDLSPGVEIIVEHNVTVPEIVWYTGLENHPESDASGRVNALHIRYEAFMNGYEETTYIDLIRSNRIPWEDIDYIRHGEHVVALDPKDVNTIDALQVISEEAYQNYLTASHHVTYSPIVAINEKPERVDTYDIKCVGSDCDNNFLANGVVVHNSGKTFCSVQAIHELKQTTMVVLDRRIDQWVNAIEEQTELRRKDGSLYVIQGHKSLSKLFSSTLQPKIIIASLPTLRSYLQGGGLYKNMMPYSEFVKHYGIGIKVVDEAHLCFHATVKIDLAADIPTNLYMTATFLTGDRMTQNIFHIYFPNQMRYDNGYKKYCRVIGINHRTKISTLSTILLNGYSHSKYEKMMLNDKQGTLFPFLKGVLYPLIKQHYDYRKYEGKKILIYFALQRTVRYVSKWIQKRFPEYKVVTYIDGDSAENLEHGDIIVSTHKGAGTGTDIKGLITVINTISFKAETTCRQVLGRLRELKNGYTPTYIDLHDINNTVQKRHWKIRRITLEKCAKSFEEHDM